VPRKNKTAETAVAGEPGTETSAAQKTPALRKPVRKRTGAAPKRRAAKSAAARTSGLSELSDEQIRTRAYFIAERRHRLGLPGDAESDWLEAKRQLLSELAPR
jgi:Protein of unknown function (DUF2934)